MTITERVLRPKEASISSPLSRTSWIMRLMGADSGLTIVITRLSEIKLPNPILISFIYSPLFDVLDLLADFFNLGFEIDNDMGNIGVLAFRANRIGLAVKFLDQEVDLTADR